MGKGVIDVLSLCTPSQVLRSVVSVITIQVPRNHPLRSGAMEGL
jgi:hypothetical protein